MEYKYQLPKNLIEKASEFSAFSTDGSQATIELNDGRVFKNALISNSSVIIALRGFDDLPFNKSDIKNIYQSIEDQNPSKANCWIFWDKW